MITAFLRFISALFYLIASFYSHTLSLSHYHSTVSVFRRYDHEAVVTIVFFDEVEGVNRRIIDEAGGRVCNPTIRPRHRGDK